MYLIYIIYFFYIFRQLFSLQFWRLESTYKLISNIKFVNIYRNLLTKSHTFEIKK